MAEFGQPYRNVTEDANAGHINPPTIKQVDTNDYIPKEVKQSKVSLDDAVSNLGSSLGSALGKHLDEERNNIIEQKKLDAARRQGTSDAINNIDANQKATGWKKFIFGEDASYREAQQRAAENGVTKIYLEQANEVWKHAGESSDEYYKNRLSPALDSLLAKYEGDVDTQRKVSRMWQTAAKKLTESHYREHDAYNQMENRNTLKERIQLASDVLTMDGANATTPHDAERVLSQASAIFNGSLIPSTMRPEAAKEVEVEVVAANVRAGNTGLFKAAQESGWIESLDPTHAAKLDKAVIAYGAELKLEASALVEQANIDASEAKTILDVEAIYDVLDDQITALERKKLGTIKSTEGILQERSEAIANERTYIQRIKSAKEKAIKKAAKAEAATQTLKENKERLNLEIGGVPTTGGIPWKPAEAQEAMDSTISDNVKKILGKDDLTPSQVAGAILTDDRANLVAVSKWSNHEASSDIVGQAITTFVNSDLSAFTDDKGRLNEEASNILARLERFRTKDSNKFNKVLGQNRLDYEVIKNGIRSGRTQKRIEKDLERLKMGAKDLPPLQKIRDSDNNRDYTTQEFVAKTIENELGENPTMQDIADMTSVFELGLRMFDNNSKAAQEYMLDDMRTGQVQVKLGGTTHLVRPIEGGEKLTNSPQKVIEWAESKGYLAGKVALLGKISNEIDKKPITRLDEIQNLQTYTVAGYEGLFLDTPTSLQPVFISIQDLKPLDEEIEQDRRFREDELAARKEAQAKYARELSTRSFTGMNVP